MKQTNHWLSLLISIAAAAGCSTGPKADPPVASSASALTEDQCNYFDANGKVRICHKTSSATHPYTVVNVSTNACIAGHAGHPDDYVAVNDPTCGGGGCLPVGGPWDPTLPCCEGLVVRNGVCTDLCAGVVCQAQDQCHVAGTCNPADGTCSNPAASNGTTCNDGSACTTSDACTNGSCAGTPVTCAPPTSCQQPGTCSTDGTCSYAPLADGTSCGTNAACQGGVCTPTVCVPKTCADYAGANFPNTAPFCRNIGSDGCGGVVSGCTCASLGGTCATNQNDCIINGVTNTPNGLCGIRRCR